MPIIRSTVNGKPCYKVQNVNKCYPYKAGDKQSMARARAKAQKQLAAVEASKHARGKK